ncbi:MAG TPA: Crp/Fnr family transcriptional regulator [Gemmatimonadaceae bacterium]|nr:Crp/Fnr family transcriptional regulator [Gemmatimonadaceae bacterium]
MKSLGSAPDAPRNRLLAALPEDDYASLRPALELVGTELRDIIYDVGQPMERVFFVETGVLSIVNLMADGSAVETATVGNEGLVGLQVYLDSDRSASQAFCQVQGLSLAMRVAEFREAIGEIRALRQILNRYTQALLIQVAQSSACNRLHPVRERCARWLLQTHDRVEGDEFPMTHDFLSQMLGVRRATVTDAAGSLQKQKLIEYEYGHLRVIDRPGLERVSCECYAIVKAEFDRLLEGRFTPSPLDTVQASHNGKSTINNGTPRRTMESATLADQDDDA